MDVEQANLHQLATEVRVQRNCFLIRIEWLGLIQHFGEGRKVLIWMMRVILLSISHQVLVGDGYRILTTQQRICTGNGTTCLFTGNLVSLCLKVIWMST